MKTQTLSQQALFVAMGLALTSPSNAANYVYDDLNRLIKVIYDSGKILDYSYDAGGNILSITTTDVNAPRYDIEGQVVDQNGQPLAGVLIKVGSQTVETDENGNYQLTNLLPGEYTLIAELDNYNFTPLDFTVGSDQPVVLDIVSDDVDAPKYDIEGQIKDQNSQPLAGVLIKIGSKTAETDENGNYQLTDLLAGDYTLIAELENYNFTPLDFTVGSDQPVELDIVSDDVDAPKYDIEGQIKDQNGQPLAGVLIKVGSQTVETDENGYYQLTDLLAGEYTLIAELENYNFTPVDFTIGENQPVVLDMVSNEQDAPKYDIQGKITDKNGQPLAGVLIKVGSQTVETDENGYYQLTDLLPGEYTLVAELENYNFTPLDFTVGSDQPVVLDMVSDGLTACLLYAVHDQDRRDTQFFTINSAQDFEVKLLGTMHYQQDIEALDMHPDSNALFAAAGDDGTHPGYLYQVNTKTGQPTKVGNGTGFHEINGLSFKPDGSLWGWAEGDGLIEIDIQTGQGQLVLAYTGPIEDITWDNNGLLLYGVEDNRILSYNNQTNELTTLTCRLPGGEVEALEMLPDGRLLFGIHDDKTVSLHALELETCQLVGTSINTQINGIILNDVEGLAWPVQACSAP
ncbi:MAG: carboxypeptidase regulatory-like domain-containing protein [Candidatus Parabeggiatoa sp.]|nr:carboxypeptidase regulatory-like domain-containing protein [Candidatus Parabeggiatoa sp.]